MPFDARLHDVPLLELWGEEVAQEEPQVPCVKSNEADDGARKLQRSKKYGRDDLDDHQCADLEDLSSPFDE